MIEISDNSPDYNLLLVFGQKNKNSISIRISQGEQNGAKFNIFHRNFQRGDKK